MLYEAAKFQSDKQTKYRTRLQFLLCYLGFRCVPRIKMHRYQNTCQSRNRRITVFYKSHGVTIKRLLVVVRLSFSEMNKIEQLEALRTTHAFECYKPSGAAQFNLEPSWYITRDPESSVLNCWHKTCSSNPLSGQKQASSLAREKCMQFSLGRVPALYDLVTMTGQNIFVGYVPYTLYRDNTSCIHTWYTNFI